MWELTCLCTYTSDVQYISIYRNIEIFIQYHDTILAFRVSIHWCGQFRKIVFLVCLILYLKAIVTSWCALIDFFYRFLTKYNQTGHLFTFCKHFNYYFKYRGTELYGNILTAIRNSIIYNIVVSHIPNLHCRLCTQ